MIRQLLARRELVWFFAIRDIKVRYAQTVFGALWALFQPLLLTAAVALLIGRLAKVAVPDVPYWAFVLGGLVPWLFFANGVGRASESLVINSALIENVYFPRVAIPLGSVLAWLPDLGIAIVIVAIAAGIAVGPSISGMLILPAFIALLLGFSVGVSLWTSSLNVAYRDVRTAIPYLLQVGLFASPVAYPPQVVPERWAWLYELNPMVAITSGFRHALLGTALPGARAVIAAVAVTLAIASLGAIYFGKVEGYFADIV